MSTLDQSTAHDHIEFEEVAVVCPNTKLLIDLQKKKRERLLTAAGSEAMEDDATEQHVAFDESEMD